MRTPEELRKLKDDSMKGTVRIKGLAIKPNPDPFQELRIREEREVNRREIKSLSRYGGLYE